MQCVAVCCSVLQCVAVRCSVLQCAGSVLAVCWQCAAVCCSVLQRLGMIRGIHCCSVMQCVAVCCSVLQGVAVCCSMLQCAAVCCSVLQGQVLFEGFISFSRVLLMIKCGLEGALLFHCEMSCKSNPRLHLLLY